MNQRIKRDAEKFKVAFNPTIHSGAQSSEQLPGRQLITEIFTHSVRFYHITVPLLYNRTLQRVVTFLGPYLSRLAGLYKSETRSLAMLAQPRS